MNNPARAVLAIALIALAAVFSVTRPTSAQLQQSGGSGGSTNVNQFGGAAVSLGSKTSASSMPVVIASDQAAIPASESGTWNVGQTGTWNVGISAGTNLIGYTRPQNACGTTNYEAGMQFLPNASTSLTATATCVSVLILNNTDAASHTVSVQDQSTACNSAACNVLSSFSIPASSQMDIPLYGTKFTGGIKWNADTANKVVANVIGNQ